MAMVVLLNSKLDVEADAGQEHPAGGHPKKESDADKPAGSCSMDH